MSLIRHLLHASILSSVSLMATHSAYAAPPDPFMGYMAVADKIMEPGPDGYPAGANFGRCHAVFVLAGKLCETETPPDLYPLLEACDGYIDIDPEELLPEDDLWGCFSGGGG